MKKIRFLISALIMLNIYLSAQETSLTLPTSDNTSSFKINSSSANIFTVSGDGKVGINQTNPRSGLELGGGYGLLVPGTFGSGRTVTSLGSGVRLFWYPGLGALRVGYCDGAYWDDNGSSSSWIGSYSIAMGYAPRASGYCAVSIGANTHALNNNALALGSESQASGNHSIAIGNRTYATGDYSMALGYGANTNNFEGSVVIGDYYYFAETNSSAQNQLSMRFSGGYRLFTVGNNSIGVSLAASGNSWASISDSTKKENIIKANGEYFLNSLSKLKLGSWNFNTQHKTCRHYGPMAQEIFYYFGKDEFGTIGNDTTLASADIDGIMMICLQALEKRTEGLLNENGKWKMENAKMKKENEEMKKLIAIQQNQMEEIVNKLAVIKSRLSDIENNSTKLTYNNFTPAKVKTEK